MCDVLRPHVIPSKRPCQGEDSVVLGPVEALKRPVLRESHSPRPRSRKRSMFLIHRMSQQVAETRTYFEKKYRHSLRPIDHFEGSVTHRPEQARRDVRARGARLQIEHEVRCRSRAVCKMRVIRPRMLISDEVRLGCWSSRWRKISCVSCHPDAGSAAS